MQAKKLHNLSHKFRKVNIYIWWASLQLLASRNRVHYEQKYLFFNPSEAAVYRRPSTFRRVDNKRSERKQKKNNKTKADFSLAASEGRKNTIF